MPRFLIRMSVLVISLGAFGTATAEEVEHPIYRSWARHPIGTTVTLRSVTTSGGHTIETTNKTMLVKLTDSTAVLETTMTSDGTGKVVEAPGAAMDAALRAMNELPEPARQYLLPFGARSRFLFKMDFAEAEYISKLRSGVKGHFSYREIAWEMKCKMEQLEPELGRLIEATPPWVEDPLKR